MPPNMGMSEILQIAGNNSRIFIGTGLDAKRKGLIISGYESASGIPPYARMHPYDYENNKSLNLVINPFGGGNVGIGTTTPSYKLDVQGGVVRAGGGLIIEVRNSPPPNPETGRIWLQLQP
jgi:hypothetical protein